LEITGSAASSSIVCTPSPGISNTISSRESVTSAAAIAVRSEPLPELSVL
jgi:hypothetical protein